MNLSQQIRIFYDQLQFPGHYTRNDLDYHLPQIRNVYLDKINKEIKPEQIVLDVGCGTGLTTNLFALHNNQTNFVGIDFSRSIVYAKDFARQNQIQNVKFLHADLLDYRPGTDYDLVICQGVLHHIPEQIMARDSLKRLVKPEGHLLIGVYHPWGKILKKYLQLNYFGESILRQDQEMNPFEITYTKRQVRDLFPDFDLVDYFPKFPPIAALMRSHSGGLSLYKLKRHVQIIA